MIDSIMVYDFMDIDLHRIFNSIDALVRAILGKG